MTMLPFFLQIHQKYAGNLPPKIFFAEIFKMLHVCVQLFCFVELFMKRGRSLTRFTEITKGGDHKMNFTPNAEQRKAFCRWYLMLGNAAEAAQKAGFPAKSAEADALRLLQTPSCRSYLAQLAAQPALPIQSLVIKRNYISCH